MRTGRMIPYPFFKELMNLRAEHARLNGHKSHFKSVAGQRMMSAESAREFLKDASRISAPYLTELANKLCSLKQQDVESRELKFHEIDDRVYPWDAAFYTRLHCKAIRECSVENIAAFFPLDSTVRELLDTFGHLFGMRFQECLIDSPEYTVVLKAYRQVHNRRDAFDPV